MVGKELIFIYVFADFAVPIIMIKWFVYKKSQMPIINTELKFQFKINICACLLLIHNGILDTHKSILKTP